jgi:hypothetical protein
MLGRLQTSGSRADAGKTKTEQPVTHPRPTFEEIKPLLEKPASEVTDEELEKIVRYNGFPVSPRRPGPQVTDEIVRQIREEEGI